MQTLIGEDVQDIPESIPRGLSELTSVLAIDCFAPWVYAAYRLFLCRVMKRTQAHE